MSADHVKAAEHLQSCASLEKAAVAEPFLRDEWVRIM